MFYPQRYLHWCKIGFPYIMISRNFKFSYQHYKIMKYTNNQKISCFCILQILNQTYFGKNALLTSFLYYSLSISWLFLNFRGKSLRPIWSVAFWERLIPNIGHWEFPQCTQFRHFHLKVHGFCKVFRARSVDIFCIFHVISFVINSGR